MLPVHMPPLHVALTGHMAHALPPLPHALGAVPARHCPDAEQHPVQDVGSHGRVGPASSTSDGQLVVHCPCRQHGCISAGQKQLTLALLRGALAMSASYREEADMLIGAFGHRQGPQTSPDGTSMQSPSPAHDWS